MSEFTVSPLLSGRPETAKSEKETECYNLLDILGIKYERVEYSIFPDDRESQRKIDKALGVPGIKNLIFRTKNRRQYFFIILPRDARFDEKAFRRKFSVPKITMASADDLSEILGTHQGAVSITEIGNDKNNVIGLYIAPEVLREKYFRFHPNENTATVRISMDDFRNILIPHLSHEINEL